jgi:hypothetical protein
MKFPSCANRLMSLHDDTLKNQAGENNFSDPMCENHRRNARARMKERLEAGAQYCEETS